MVEVQSILGASIPPLKNTSEIIAMKNLLNLVHYPKLGDEYISDADVRSIVIKVLPEVGRIIVRWADRTSTDVHDLNAWMERNFPYEKPT